MMREKMRRRHRKKQTQRTIRRMRQKRIHRKRKSKRIGRIHGKRWGDGRGGDRGRLKCLGDGEQTDYSVITETEDLKAVMDFVKAQPCVDASRITMMGQSMGGLVTSLVAAERADEIADVVLFYPGLMAPENLREEYPMAADLPTEPAKFLGAEVGPVFFWDSYDLDVYGTIGNYTGLVLLLHGTADKLVPVSVSEKALEVYENAELKVIEGGNHGFPPLEDGTNVREIAYNYIMEFLENR